MSRLEAKFAEPAADAPTNSLAGRILDAADRYFDPLPLSPDRYGRGFFLTLAATLILIGVAYWTIHSYWDVDWFAREDRALEWVSSVMLAAGGVMSAITGRRLVRAAHSRIGAVHVALAVVLVLAFFEEISWGQRLFDWSTPSLLIGANEQNETNFHNIPVFERVLYSALMWISVLALVGTAARLILHRQGRVTTADFIVPPLVLAPALLLVIIWAIEGSAADAFRDLFPYAPVGSEFTEAVFGVFILFYAWGNVRRSRALG